MKNLILQGKKQALVLMLLLSGMSLMAEQVVVTVSIRGGADPSSTGGGIENALKAEPLSLDNAAIAAITDLKVITTANVYLEPLDFAFLNTTVANAATAKTPNLVSLDLSEAAVTTATNRTDNAFPTGAFLNNSTIKTIVFPATLVGVNANAFANTALEGIIDIPKNVNGAANFDYNRFGNSQGITGFAAHPESTVIKTVDGVLFNFAMTELHYYPSGKTEAAYTIPEGVEIIRNSAFEHNHNLKTLTWASTITAVQAGATNFTAIASQSEIENVFVAPGNTVFGSSNGILYLLAEKRVVWSPRGKTELRIAAPVVEIAGGGSQNSAFGGNGNNTITGTAISNNYTSIIRLLDFPATLTTIANGAFVGAANLATVISRATTPPTAGTDAFRNIGSSLAPQYSTKVYVPATAIDAYKAATVWKTAFNLANYAPFYNLSLTGATAVSTIATDIAPVSGLVTVTANEAPDGQAFRRWTSTPEVGFVDATNPSTTFVMPASDVSIQAVYETYYTVEVTDGSAIVNQVAADKVFAGDVVTITADDAPLGKVFKNWTSTPEVEFENANSATTTFTVPANNVVITANFVNDITNIATVGLTSNENYIVYNTVGQPVAKGITQGNAIPELDLSKGVYFLKIGDKVIKFIKK